MEESSENILQININSLYRGDKILISESDIDIAEYEKIALIGRNGSGKSTLLETIYKVSTNQEPDTSIDFLGNINIPNKSRVGYLPQDIKLQNDQTVQEYINEQMGEKAEIYNRYIEYTGKIETNKLQYNEEYASILEKMDTYSLWRYPEELATILQGFDFPTSFLKRNIRSLSGGEATKMALISLLISKPDLLLLDEPTNNLDLNNILFLEEWFKKTPSALIIVSHDRDFLNNVIGTIWEIDEETKHINKYGGNYSFYEEEKQRQFDARTREYEEQEAKKSRLMNDIKRLKEKAKSFDNYSNNDFYRAKGAKIAKSGKSREKRIERELEKIGEPLKPKLPKFILSEISPIQGNILTVKDLSFGFEQPLFTNLSIKLSGQDRLAILGPNGTGKSTLLKILIGKIKAQGEYDINPYVKIGYLPQSIIPKDPNQDIITYMRSFSNLTESELQETLGRVLFTSPLHLRVKDFSIGELKRIQLAMIFSSGANLLLLDEPTNHLDIHTLNMLEKSLREYKGAIIVVSHDREFLRRTNINKDITIN